MKIQFQSFKFKFLHCDEIVLTLAERMDNIKKVSGISQF